MGNVFTLAGVEIACTVTETEATLIQDRQVTVSLPSTMKKELDAICREGHTPSSYVRWLLEQDLEARKDMGWTPTKGWPAR